MFMNLKNTVFVIITSLTLVNPAFACKSEMISALEVKEIVLRIAETVGAQFANREIGKNIETRFDTTNFHLDICWRLVDRCGHRSRRRHRQTRHAPRAPTLVRHPPAGERRRHPHRPGPPRP